MILSPYHNPPYRSPTPNTSRTTPPPGPSPKRKRPESVTQPSEALRIQTNLRETSDHPVSECDSPRSKVAAKFRDLGLNGAGTGPDARDHIEAKAKRKRLRTNDRMPTLSPSPQSQLIIAETPVQRRAQEDSSGAETAEIQETPQIDRGISSSPSAPEDALLNFRAAARTLSQRGDDEQAMLISPERTPLPSSPKGTISSPPREPIPDRALSPLRLGDELSLDQAALTWQDSEITGHEIDASLGDDGLGINGIGFRPTPAMAYARTQKRKQQVNEWKAREAREARQRRIDRRRGGSGSDGAAEEGPGVRRVVRFEDLG